jgi:hypothetical protein
VSVLNLGSIMATAVFAAACYVPYYLVWLLFFSRSSSRPETSQAYALTQHHGANAHAVHPPVVAQAVVARPGPAVRPAAPRPLSIKQWRVAKRKQLALIKPSVKGAELTGSWMGAMVVIAVFTALVAIFQVGSGVVDQPYIVGLVWSATMAFICSWLAIALGKRWQTSEGDSAVRSFIQLTLGLAVGGAAFALSNYLMIPWSTIATDKFGDLPIQRWRGFFAEDGTPLLPAFLAYFPLLMGVVHWWKQADPLRRNRFSLFSVLWCVLMAGVVQLIIPFPQPWGALVFAGTSIAVQLSTPWHNPDERLEMAQERALA